MNADDRVIKDQKETDLGILQKDLTFHREERDRLTTVASEALRAGIRSANAGNVAFGFIAYRMTVTHDNDLMRATIQFEDFENQIFEACFDKVNVVSVDCPAVENAANTETRHKANLSLNRDKGRIEFTMVIDDPDAVGLGYKARNEASPDYFMELTADKIKGTTLNFQLYPNRMQKSSILTGKALFTATARTSMRPAFPCGKNKIKLLRGQWPRLAHNC